MTHTTIAPTTADDIPDLQQVVTQTELFPGEMLPEMLSPVLGGQAEGIWLTCHINGVAVGLAYTVPEEMTDRTWNMLALAVRPDLQGSGIGKALVQATEEALSAKGQRILIVDTSGTEAYAGARAFYACIGFDQEARLRDFWADGDDKVTFRKAL